MLRICLFYGQKHIVRVREMVWAKINYFHKVFRGFMRYVLCMCRTPSWSGRPSISSTYTGTYLIPLKALTWHTWETTLQVSTRSRWKNNCCSCCCQPENHRASSKKSRMNLENTLVWWSERVPLRRIQELERVDVMQKLSIYCHTDSVEEHTWSWHDVIQHEGQVNTTRWSLTVLPLTDVLVIKHVIHFPQ